MNNKYFIYALVVTFITTTVSWTRMVASSTSSGAGSSWRSTGGYSGGSHGGGGHK
ncbi:hypothetical protein [Massilia cavernae]|uniref:hypothetical protein n=1 Tax=Massilia cavernae TaxID=2320864 RepID=UPI001601EEEF|nr:hypothetical protein [Massilia cavernae]